MVRCLIKSHNQQYKMSQSQNEDAEGMCTSVASLEPDPRYSGCCSKIFRPGRVLRDIVVGALVIIAIAVVIAVVFVVCFFFIPSKTGSETSQLGEESAFHGGPLEEEGPYRGINEVEFHNNTRYDVNPELERVVKGEEDLHGHDHAGHEGHDHGHDHEGHTHDHDHEGHEEHHHVGPIPESEPEPEPESEPEPTAEPEATPEPEPAGDHTHTHPEMDHDHTHPEADHDHTHPVVDHEHAHEEGLVTHDHTHPEMDHDHTHPEADHDHTHPAEGHEHTQEHGPVTHDHTHPEMDHDHTHPEADHDHTHADMDHEHIHPVEAHEHAQERGPLAHDHTHPEMDHDHTHPEADHDHTHPAMDHEHEHIHPDEAHEHAQGRGPLTHDHTHPEMDHDHTHPEADHDHTHPAMDHDHSHPAEGHEHTQEQGPLTHDHTHPAADHDHTHPEADHDHTHPAADHDHTHTAEGHDQTQQEPVTHDHSHPEMDHDHTHPEMDHDHTHPAADHDHTHPAEGHDHTHEQAPHTPDHTHPATDHDHTHPEMDHDHTHSEIHSHSSDDSPKAADTEVHHVSEASESEVSVVPTTHSPSDREESSLPPLFELFSHRTPTEDHTEHSPEGSEGTLRELIVPEEHQTEAEHHHAEAHPDEVHGVAVDEATAEVPEGQCQPRQLEMCSDLPHTLTAFPNWAGDQTEEDMQKTSLPFLRDVIVRSRCSPRAKEYSCAILEPPCTPEGSVLPPCRTFCKSVASTCQEFITSRFSLSSAFDCDKFPDSSDPSVCFDMTQAEGITPEQMGFSPFLRLPAAPQDGLRNEESSTNSSSDSPTPSTEAHAEDRATLGHHPASESNAPPFILRPAGDYQADYPEEIVDDLTGNSDYPFDYPLEFTNFESPTAPTRGASAITPESHFDPGSFVVPPVSDTACGQNEFECADGSVCLPSVAVCDGLQHCGDGSDEANCQHVDSVQDDNTTTIMPTPEEAEGTEATLLETTTLAEEGETTTATQCPELQCLDGTCISFSQVNDGVKDCPLGLDEEDFGGLI